MRKRLKWKGRTNVEKGDKKDKVEGSVSDPYHFDADPDPRIRIRDDGSGS